MLARRKLYNFLYRTTTGEKFWVTALLAHADWRRVLRGVRKCRRDGWGLLEARRLKGVR
jgi:hypothetical protein